MVLAAGPKPRSPPAPGRRPAAIPRALRPRSVGPPAVPVVLELGIQARGLCAGAQTPLRSLRYAHVMGRANAGLGQSEGGQSPVAARTGIYQCAATRQHLSAC